MPVVVVSFSLFSLKQLAYNLSLGLSSSLYGSLWISLSLWILFPQKVYDSVSYYFVFI